MVCSGPMYLVQPVQLGSLLLFCRPLPLSYMVFDGPALQPPLVFLHGLLGSKGNFRAIARALVQRSGRKVLTVDARNHGESPHSPVMSYEAMSLDVQRLLRQLHLPKCVLVGHSMGGKTAMTLALQQSHRERDCDGFPGLHRCHEESEHPGQNPPLHSTQASRGSAESSCPALRTTQRLSVSFLRQRSSISQVLATGSMQISPKSSSLLSATSC
nr:protein ABHD11 isoform X4 [Pelodiscus sinensis]|eukprot:XP_014427363.1 protein ABHD11 isoform X4 [Pelodiscus sinensis]